MLAYNYSGYYDYYRDYYWSLSQHSSTELDASQQFRIITIPSHYWELSQSSLIANKHAQFALTDAHTFLHPKQGLAM